MKPIIPNGFSIGDFCVTKRIYGDECLEIYQTNRQTFLHLLRKNIDIKESKRARFKIFPLHIAHERFFVFESQSSHEHRLKELLSELESIAGFDAVAGMRELKIQLTQDIIKPIREKEKYARFNLAIPNGVLFYGPTGCGKTFMAQKLAEELGFSFIEVKHSDVSTPYIHGGVGKIAEVFNQARQSAPAIVFFDELDGLLPHRSKLDGNQSHKLEEVNEFLLHLNNASKSGVLVIGATNQIALIDEAVLRSGRFDKKIYVGEPDLEARISLFRMHLKSRPLCEVDYGDLGEMTEGYSCADIALICDDAARLAVNRACESITQDILRETIAKIPSSLGCKTSKRGLGMGFI